MTNKKQQETNKKDQSELFATLDLDALKEFAPFLGLRDLPEDITREDLIAKMEAVKNGELAVAKTVKIDGKQMECPVGHMIIKVTPKSGDGWGPKSKEMFFFSVQGQHIAGKRGIPQIVHEKYRSAWTDAVKTEYEQTEEDSDPTRSPTGRANITTRDVFAEDVLEIAHVPDTAEAERIQREIEEGARLYQAEKKAERIAKQAFYQNMTR